MRGWIPGIKLNTIYAKLLGTYLMITAFGTSLMAGYILWSFHNYFMRSRQVDLDNWTSALSESVADALLKAILNLLDNAIKHSPANSQVSISGYSQGKQAIIQIQDQGKGIKEGDLPRIFEQFYTTDPARQGSGNGLGLAISKRIIEAHQGSIIASSTPNQGATFTIHLPIIRNS